MLDAERRSVPDRLVSRPTRSAGTRPIRPAFLAEVSSDFPQYWQRLVVRPGVTGFAQTRITREDAWEYKLAHDLEYIADRSLSLYLQVIIATARRVLGLSVRGGWQQVGEWNTLVADLAQRQAEYRPARRRAEPHADDDRAGLDHRADRPGVRAGQVAADALLPDQIAARVGQHQGRAILVLGDDTGP